MSDPVPLYILNVPGSTSTRLVESGVDFIDVVFVLAQVLLREWASLGFG